MIKILVCINDGLLKLRINRLLTVKGYQFTITDKAIKRNDLINYEAVIIHSSYYLNNLLAFIENAVIQKLTTIMYITSNVNANPFSKFTNHPNLILIEEIKMDIELPLALNIFVKYAEQIRILNEESQELDRKLKESNILAKCKRAYMDRGLNEEEAHKMIIKYAMDHHLSKYNACKSLLESISE